MPTGTEIEIVWSFLGKIAAILGVIVAAIKAIQYLNSLTPAAKLELRVAENERKLNNDFEHLKAIDEKIAHLEKKTDDTQLQIKEVNEGIQRIGKSQISLLRHFVTGNGQKEMSEEADDLTAWFIDR